MSMFWGVRPPAYVSQLEWLKDECPECYFVVSRRGEKIINGDVNSEYYWTEKHKNIKWWFWGIYFKTVETKKWPKEKMCLELRDNDWEQKLIFSSWWNKNVRRFIWCFAQGQRIWYLELVTYNRQWKYIDKLTGKEKQCINKWFSVFHNGEKVVQIEDPERDRIAEGLKRDTDDDGSVTKTHRKPLNEYMKDVAISFKPVERTQEPRVTPETKSVDNILQDDSDTPIIDSIKRKIAEDDDDDLPF